MQDFWQIYFIITQKDGVETVEDLYTHSLGSSWGILSEDNDTGLLSASIMLVSEDNDTGLL